MQLLCFYLCSYAPLCTRLKTVCNDYRLKKKVTGEGTAQKDYADPHGHFIGNCERFLKGFYLKPSRSKHICKKKFQLLPTPVVFAPQEVFVHT